MKLAEIVEVNQVEQTIEQKQRELSQLYVKRACLMKQLDSYSQTQLEYRNNLDLMARTMYDELSLTLSGFGINVPAFRLLRRRLINARVVMDDLESEWPDSIGSFKTFLLPPCRLVPLPIKKKWRKAQFKRSQEVYDDSITLPKYHLPHRKSWEVMVISANQRGIYRGEPAKIIDEKLYKVKDHDTRGLGVEEYAILSLYLAKPIDTATRTMLLKDYTHGQSVQVVHYSDGRYEFESDDSGMVGLFSGDVYRPAVLIR